MGFFHLPVTDSSAVTNSPYAKSMPARREPPAVAMTMGRPGCRRETRARSDDGLGSRGEIWTRARDKKMKKSKRLLRYSDHTEVEEVINERARQTQSDEITRVRHSVCGLRRSRMLNETTYYSRRRKHESCNDATAELCYCDCYCVRRRGNDHL